MSFISSLTRRVSRASLSRSLAAASASAASCSPRAFSSGGLASLAKRSTGITGLDVAPRGREALIALYEKTLSDAATLLPAGTAYRAHVESFTNYRLGVCRAAASVSKPGRGRGLRLRGLRARQPAGAIARPHRCVRAGSFSAAAHSRCSATRAFPPPDAASAAPSPFSPRFSPNPLSAGGRA